MAIIAAVTYYFWQEFRHYRAGVEIVANQPPLDHGQAPAPIGCAQVLDRLKALRAGDDEYVFYRGLVADCRQKGKLSLLETGNLLDP
ncbi:hypothetical protein NKH89_10230 [Mesorhizobium sp. M0923]|uniref:hypothetical protein n=1 Tax=Mesorhizobium sp. M0923 TaxID=2957028 RepID=UPI0033385716